MSDPSRRCVAVLHTSLLFVEGDRLFRDLFDELLAGVRVIDLVDGDLLATVRRDDGVGPASVRRFCNLALSARDAGADAIFSVCSSLGPAADVARRIAGVPLVKVDDAMAREAVDRADRIGVLATVSTTLAPTVDLVRSAAAARARRAIVASRLADAAFNRLLEGDRAGHDRAVVSAAKSLAGDVDVIVLAQASMARLAPTLAEACRIPVLSSPRSGVEDLARALGVAAFEPLPA